VYLTLACLRRDCRLHGGVNTWLVSHAVRGDLLATSSPSFGRGGWVIAPVDCLRFRGGVGAQLPRAITRRSSIHRSWMSFEPWTNVHSLDSGYISGALRLQKQQGWTACGPSGTRRLPADWLQYGLWSLSLALCSADSRLAVQNMKRKLRGGPWAARRAGGRGGACVSCRLTQRLPARSGARVSL